MDLRGTCRWVSIEVLGRCSLLVGARASFSSQQPGQIVSIEITRKDEMVAILFGRVLKAMALGGHDEKSIRIED